MLEPNHLELSTCEPTRKKRLEMVLAASSVPGLASLPHCAHQPPLGLAEVIYQTVWANLDASDIYR